MVFFFSLFLFSSSCTKSDSTSSKINQNDITVSTAGGSLGCNFNPAGCTIHSGISTPVPYAGCSYEVHFTYFVCPDGVVIRDMFYNQLGGQACGSFDANILNLIANNQNAAARAQLDARHKFMADHVQNYILNAGNFNKLNYQCGSATNFTSTFIAADCIAICGSEGTIIEANCGGTCCIKKQGFCYDGETLMLVGSPILEKGDDSPCNNGVHNCTQVLRECDGSDCKRLGGGFQVSAQQGHKDN